MRSAFACFVAVLSLSTIGCGLTHERGGDADAGTTILGDAGIATHDAIVVGSDAVVVHPDAWTPPFTIAPHGPEPILPDQGGPRMSHPQLVVITYADDDDRSSLEAHATWLTTSSWITTVGAEYGITGASILGLVELPGHAPDTITDTEIKALTRSGIADHSLPSPADGSLSNVIYIHYFPSHTSITDDFIGTSCVSHAGYHNGATMPDGRAFAYAVIPDCGGAMFLNRLEQREEATAHEVIEAATDALPLDSPAWAFGLTDPEPSPWLAAGAEVADLCEYRDGPAAFYREGGFVAARVWSNTAARAGDRDPCVPDAGGAFGTLSITPATILPGTPGGVVTFDVTAWSTAPMPAMSVAAFGAMATTGTFTPDASLDRTAMSNGDHATLTVRIPAATPSGTYGITYVYVQQASGDSDILPAVVYVP
jgi:hypothetical protein